MIGTDKSTIPAVLGYQDRGKMTFPHKVLLPFMKKCSVAIKQHLNSKQFKKQGRKVVSHAKSHVLADKNLVAELDAIVSFRCGSTSSTIVSAVYEDITRRVIHTMANSLLHSQAMLERIAKNKGVDAEMALRDRLKAYALDKQTSIKL